MKYSKLIFALLFLPLITRGQISFTESTYTLINDPENTRSGVAVGISDMNGDYHDDLILLNQAKEFNVKFQTGSSQKFKDYFFGEVSPTRQWALVTGDIKNEGHSSLIAGDAGRLRYFKSENNETFQEELLTNNNFFVQNMNLVDLNNDGHLDLYACDDNALSRVYISDSLGNLSYSLNYSNGFNPFGSDSVSNDINSGNYGSIFTDVDNDNDLDLYISKCRSGVSDFSDPRRVNQLWINNDGTYSEQANLFGINNGAQSWATDFGDFDNDGDMDLVMVNHNGAPSIIMRNDGFNFRSLGSIDAGTTPIQVTIHDFDNNGHLDILISGSEHFLYMNNGGFDFYLAENPFGLSQMMSYAVGDLNSDGFLDVYSSYGVIFTQPGVKDDVIHLNNGNDNNFMIFSLKGNASNRQGVGAKLKIYGAFGIQVREIQLGESYGIQNTLNAHFGIGTYEAIDSLVIHWPSGTIDKFTDLNVNTHYLANEGNCITPFMNITSQSNFTFCEGDSIVLNAPNGFDHYEWSNGDTSSSVTVSSEDLYFVKMRNENDACLVITKPVRTFIPSEKPEVEKIGEDLVCEGDTIILRVNEGQSFLWNTGDMSQEISVIESGSYTVRTVGLCEEFDADPINISFFENADLMIENDSINIGDTAFISATGANKIQWFDSEVSALPIFEGENYSVPNLDTSTTLYVRGSNAYQLDSIVFGEVLNDTGEYSRVSSGLNFFVESPFTLNKVKVETDTLAKRTIEIYSIGSGEVVYKEDFFIEAGISNLDINFYFENFGSYQIYTNQDTNEVYLNSVSPRLHRTEDVDNFPYTVPGIVSITNSLIGSTYYYYFYDWEIQPQDFECTGSREEVKIFVDQKVSNKNIPLENVKIYPNPTNGNLSIAQVENRLLLLDLKDMNGRNIFSQSFNDLLQQFDFSHLPNGIYILHLQSGNKISQSKILIQK